MNDKDQQQLNDIKKHLSEDEFKKWTKEAVQEWLDDKFVTFGKWSVVSVAAIALASFIYFALWFHGWVRI